MADLEEVFLERLQRTVTEDEPFLPDWDEDQAALDNHYAQSDLAETLARFTAQRASVLAFLEALPAAGWHRTSLRQDKRCDLLGMAAILLGHDGYHLKQLVEYREQILSSAVS
jgi:DinB superfamily